MICDESKSTHLLLHLVGLKNANVYEQLNVMKDCIVSGACFAFHSTTSTKYAIINNFNNTVNIKDVDETVPKRISDSYSTTRLLCPHYTRIHICFTYVLNVVYQYSGYQCTNAYK